MKTIIIHCSPVSFYTIDSIVDGVPEKTQMQIFTNNLNKAVYSLLEKNTRIYLKGSLKFTEKVKTRLKEYIVTQNSNFKDIVIEQL